ncbi:uncharacterized protein Tco025E_04053 [Trypanosoma conorhini]|uniref:Uncharacterized protein n=1 Tax=Trypanosoma conorhini TaxID=83891 RepID=A0A422PQB8_9TRYP|nr:uncharacterized protein Tco025E_04053 [Trypanosoma conorhini]RNF19912.1 hypothetical protein Tco025E_04053 [Trypanosoma conorhini]
MKAKREREREGEGKKGAGEKQGASPLQVGEGAGRGARGRRREEKGPEMAAKDPRKPPTASHTPRECLADTPSASEPRQLSSQTFVASDVLDEQAPCSARWTDVSTPSQSIDSLVGHLLLRAAEEEGNDNTWKLLLANEESVLRDIIENEAFTELARRMRAFHGRSSPSSVCESGKSHSASTRVAGRLGVDAAALESCTAGASMERADSALRAVPARGLGERREEAKVPAAGTADLSVSGPRLAMHVRSRSGGPHGGVEEARGQAQRRSSHVVPSYGTMTQGVQAGAADSSTHVNARGGLGVASPSEAVVGEEAPATASLPLYEGEMPVIKPSYDSVPDPAMDAAWEAEGLLTTGVKPQAWLRAMMRQALFCILAVGLFFPSMAHSGLFAGLDLFSNAESSAPRRSVMKFTLLFADAAAFCVTTPFTAILCRGGRLLRHGVLLAATTTTVGSGLCLLHGYSSGSLVLLLLSQLLHAVGLAASVVAVLCVNCAEMGALLGTVSLLFVAVHLWFLSGAAGLFIFSAVARLRSGGAAEALRVFLYLTSTGPVFALAVCALVSPAESDEARPTLDAVRDARKIFVILRSIDVRFVLRCLACGCLLAVLLLLTEAGPQFSLLPAGAAAPPLFAYLFSLTVLVALPLFLLPSLGPFVRFCGFGPLTAVAAAALLGLISMTAPSASTAPATLPMFAASAILCGAALALTLAGVMRSLASAGAGAPSVVVVPALLFATLLSLCVALAAGLTAVLLGARLQASNAGGALAGQARCVNYVALATCLGALCLQITTVLNACLVRPSTAAAPCVGCGGSRGW